MGGCPWLLKCHAVVLLESWYRQNKLFIGIDALLSTLRLLAQYFPCFVRSFDCSLQNQFAISLGVQYFRPGSRKDGGSHRTPQEAAFAETEFEASSCEEKSEP